MQNRFAVERSLNLMFKKVIEKQIIKNCQKH